MFTEQLKYTDPEFAELFRAFAYHEVPSDAPLPSDDRYLAILAALMGCQGIDLFPSIVNEALNASLAPSAIRETVYQGTAYLGIGRTYPFFGAMNAAFTEHGIELPLPSEGTVTSENRITKGNEVQIAAFGDGMRGFQNAGPEESRHINRWLAGNCFGDYYTRNGLTLRQREMVTFCYIAAQGGCDPQATAHAGGNLSVGNDKQYLICVLSNIMPYIGYPRTLNALRCINEAAK